MCLKSQSNHSFEELWCRTTQATSGFKWEAGIAHTGRSMDGWCSQCVRCRDERKRVRAFASQLVVRRTERKFHGDKFVCSFSPGFCILEGLRGTHVFRLCNISCHMPWTQKRRQAPHASKRMSCFFLLSCLEPQSEPEFFEMGTSFPEGCLGRLFALVECQTVCTQPGPEMNECVDTRLFGGCTQECMP
jgi:hypothetical protein